MPERILVTGGAGFIGSHLVDFLLARDTEVLVLDNLDPFYERSLKESNIARHKNICEWRYRFCNGDICDKEFVNQIMRYFRPDMVVHLAARAGVRPSLESPLSYMDTNVTGTVHILEACVTSDVKKLIYASSSSVYGLNRKIPFSEDDSLLCPASPYAASKIAAEAICKSYSHCYGLPVVSLRFFTVYGPRQRPDLAIHKFVRKIMNDETISLYGDGSSMRDYTYISDIVRGIVAAMQFDGENTFEVFNLGNDSPVTLVHLVQKLEGILDRPAQITWLPEQKGDVPVTWADITKARELLDYQVTTRLDEGLQRFASWIRELQEV